MIADPLRLFDFCMESDYGCAAIVTTAERAKDLRQTPAYISGAVAAAPYRYGHALMGSYNMPDDDFASSGQRAAAEELYRVSGRDVSDLDAVMVYDHFTAMAIMSLEDFGICKKGEGGPYVAEGNLRMGSTLPVNTHGGNLAEVYAHGISHVFEAVHQVRGDANNQVPGAENVLVIAGSSPSPSSGMIVSGAA